MTRPQFLIAELCLVAAGLVLLVTLFDMPFGGGSDDAGVADVPDVVGEVSIDVIGGASAGGAGTDDGGSEDGGDCGPETGSDFLAGNQVVSYYGSPYTADLGILGALPEDEMVGRLREQAAAYDEVNGFKGVQPAFHLVSTTAQPEPGADGEYVLRVDEETLEDWVDLACEEGMLIFLDIQRGHADLVDEIERIRPFLELPHVHLALDPEFAMADGEIPGQAVGGYTAEEINDVQEVLKGIVQEKGIPDKMLVVHQFEVEMIDRPWDITSTDNVAVVVTMDGFGDPQSKAQHYRTYSQPVEYGGIKLFYTIDQPLMTEAEVAALYPSVIIYQ